MCKCKIKYKYLKINNLLLLNKFKLNPEIIRVHFLIINNNFKEKY